MISCVQRSSYFMYSKAKLLWQTHLRKQTTNIAQKYFMCHARNNFSLTAKAGIATDSSVEIESDDSPSEIPKPPKQGDYEESVTEIDLLWEKS